MLFRLVLQIFCLIYTDILPRKRGSKEAYFFLSFACFANSKSD